MSKLKIRIHEDNGDQLNRFADGTKTYLVPRIIKALDEMSESGEIDNGLLNNRRELIRKARKLLRNPEVRDAMDWWLNGIVTNYLKEKSSSV